MTTPSFGTRLVQLLDEDWDGYPPGRARRLAFLVSTNLDVDDRTALLDELLRSEKRHPTRTTLADLSYQVRNLTDAIRRIGDDLHALRRDLTELRGQIDWETHPLRPRGGT